LLGVVGVFYEIAAENDGQQRTPCGDDEHSEPKVKQK
jgi:hypothetical protein